MDSGVPPPPTRCDLAIVGGGIVGLAVARESALRHPRLRICVLEKEARIATHQTGHSSGVVHAGIYYEPGSLKARLCVEGARELYAFCSERGIPHARTGKLIVATAPAELPRLDELERRGRANGVPGLRRLDAEQLREVEPHARGLAALHSPATGVADFVAVARALGDELRELGGTIATAAEVTGVSAAPRALRLAHAATGAARLGHAATGASHADSGGTLEAAHTIFCAGAWADRLAVAAGADPDPRIVPFRGAYLRLRPERRELVRSLIYPVPDPDLPFLGVHLTRAIGGEVLIGPTALLAAARDAYSPARIVPGDVLSTLAWPGSWRLVRRWWRTGMRELAHAALRPALVRAATRFVPELRVRDVEPAFAGVRAQALARDGRLLDDFAFSSTHRALHLRNAPSPAATSALAIARLIADRADATFGLDGG